MIRNNSNIYDVNGNLSKNNDLYYKEGFFTKLNNEELKQGINKDIIYTISKKRLEPKWMLEFRLAGYHAWCNMKEPHWLKGNYQKLNYNSYSYFSAPACATTQKTHKVQKNRNTLLNKSKYLTTEVEQTFNKLGIPVHEKGNVAVDAIFDSVSVSTTFRNTLLKKGIIFCSFHDAIRDYPDLVRQYLGTVVSFKDNFFAALNAAVVSDGTFVYIPKNVHCPMELSTYFRMNSKKTGQFERTILIADEGSYVSYIEGCSAPIHNNYQLHAAVVEVIVLKDAQVKYSTVQNWFSGNQNSQGGILNFVTKRALCSGENAKMSWTQSESGSAITWKYPSVILKGKNSIGEFFSVAVTNGTQQADTGTKMIHIGENTRSTIISKGIALGNSQNTYRGLVKIMKTASNSRNFTQCDSMLIGKKCSSHTFPVIESHNNHSQLEHEATTSRISDNQLFYCRQRGINEDDAISMIVNGFCKDIFSKLPLEFSVEAQKLLEITLEHSVG
ncbi:Fe-S cluster assembly protein SufB [Blochmannia endosymbiont of Camponotus modoc]|uniref:Fe-S cluster assembly protein SufB n=1 Tax=Blochmannia endosymbiont of Camponotus modoc TaxID=2945587 RepID=UPI0020241C1C|nr:Fe-S cluster assembly protein SufB [Blochmannia endosymbiont of Camponotus modoc]URJ26420.1 Fe-S cluster assembly protein SufB [Blochmannia endosymbiont of Camponotus modoc]URJ31541.1 Fe-S cluster assembly protein SufB [Blochmannia endosymbiont of Camponotus modoc]